MELSWLCLEGQLEDEVVESSRVGSVRSGSSKPNGAVGCVGSGSSEPKWWSQLCSERQLEAVVGDLAVLGEAAQSQRGRVELAVLGAEAQSRIVESAVFGAAARRQRG